MQKKLILNKSTVTIRKPGMSGTQMVVPRRPKPVPVQGAEPNFADARLYALYYFFPGVRPSPPLVIQTQILNKNNIFVKCQKQIKRNCETSAVQVPRI